MTLGDVNNDGLPDIVFANGKGTASYAYLNSSKGFEPDRRLELATSNAKACAVADLNRDGHNDIFFTNHHASNNRLTHSYLYWGGEKGFSDKSRQEFETVGAWGVSVADLNHDQYPEIIVSNYKEHFSFDVPSVILWNSEGTFSDVRRTSLFTQGAVGNLVSDFNRDGHPDLLFMNTVSRSRGGVVPTYIYWGNREGQYTPEDRLALPSVDPYEWAAADLNDDGWVDFLVSNFGETVRWRQESYIYWGSSGGFSVDSRSALMGVGSAGASIADLDQDGHLDVILSNSPRPEDGVKGAFIYWGSPEGFVVTERSEVPGGGTSTVADLNLDGRPDLVFGGSEGVGIFWNDGSREFSESRKTLIPDSKGMRGSEVADVNRDSYLDVILTRGGSLGKRQTTGFVYWGNPSGEYKSEGRLEFATEGLITLTVGDVNQDGWLDFICPSYNTGSSRATMTKIYLGGPDGISSDRMFELPSNAGTGSMVADFNRDGYADILIICHRSRGRSQPDRILRRPRDRFLSLLGKSGGFPSRSSPGDPGAGPPLRFGGGSRQHLRSAPPVHLYLFGLPIWRPAADRPCLAGADTPWKQPPLSDPHRGRRAGPEKGPLGRNRPAPGPTSSTLRPWRTVPRAMAGSSTGPS